MGNWFSRNFRTIIYIAFLVPIITVAIVSISHVTIWYGISNPLSWAVYLSIGIEIAALSALAAISAQMGSKVYVPFGIVTLIQFVGNIFFAFEYIDITSEQFLSWVELVGPILEYTGIEQADLQSQRRFLAIFAGGMLPLISLSFLHMLVKFNEENTVKSDKINQEKSDSEDKTSQEEPIQASDLVAEVSRFRPSQEELDRIEELLKKYPHDEDKKEEETTEDKTSDLPDEARGFEPPKPPTWFDDIPLPSEEDFKDFEITTNDGLEDESWNEIEIEDFKKEFPEPEVSDADLSDEEKEAFINETVPEPFATEKELEELRKIDVVLDELPSTPEPFEVDVKIVVPTPTPTETRGPANRYEQLNEYIEQTRTWGEEGQLPDTIEKGELNLEDGSIQMEPTQEPPKPNFVVKEPLPQDPIDPEKKN